MTQYPLMTEPCLDPAPDAPSAREHFLRQAESDADLFAEIIGIRECDDTVDLIAELMEVAFGPQPRDLSILRGQIQELVIRWASRKARECGGE